MLQHIPTSLLLLLLLILLCSTTIATTDFPPNVWSRVGPTGAGFTFARDGALQVDPTNSQVSFFEFTNGAPYDVTVTLTITPADGSGLNSVTFNGTSVANPSTHVVPFLTETPLKVFQWDRIAASISWNTKIGSPSGAVTADFGYPWDAATPFRVDQGFFGTATHTQSVGNEHNWHAIDANLPTGTPVLAARKGIVIDFEATQLDGTGTANYVRLLHADGSTSSYVHLKPPPGNVDVSMGDGVEQGAQLGLSGETGMASGPHLHFSVSVPTGTTTSTYPTSHWEFIGSCVPLQGESYPGGMCGVAMSDAHVFGLTLLLLLQFVVVLM